MKIKNFKWYHWIILAICLFALAATGFFSYYWYLLLSGGPILEPFSMSLPFDKDEEATGISPAGELLYHEGGLGHCGLDFGFNHRANIISSADAKIAKISQRKEDGYWDIITVSGDYAISYNILEDYDTGLKVGSYIKKGDLIGHPPGKNDGQNFAFHFEFATTLSLTYPMLERLCPYTYFDAESRERIDRIWANSDWPYKEMYPDICNGGYKGRNTLQDALRMDRAGYANTFDYKKDREKARLIDENFANEKKVDDYKSDSSLAK